ncbi:L,D-transpeptidase family protein [Fictibacillus barbaricus]|uniref:L,D-transpeptidase family protein n=1 Tax=Fictibacillus barbaricus TaxID=182136 RepID=A0ABS2ZEV8_9BACL|nr:L,D-transpeptidase family protein [Fictibacillus barbaricus]MBN3546723.1 L,D-transpeptidase family protein [Fictibacillus barbaricus]GGB43365.1 hypothetical protein GCM10007199_05830 [Fictibacillus barbaricus]
MQKKKIVLFILSFFASTLLNPFQTKAAVTIPYEKQLLSHALTKKGSTQVIIVKADSASSYKAVLAAYQHTSTGWKRVYTYPAVLGKNGISSQKVEGDGKSPAGMYFMGQAFGSVAKPAGVKLSYKKTTAYDYWIDDVTSADYNRWRVYEGNPYSKWKSFERLNHPLYKYATVIRYNEKPIIGKGSAIFLHMWKSSTSPTLGCTAVHEGNALRLMQWMDPAKRPLFIQGTEADLKRMSEL